MSPISSLHTENMNVTPSTPEEDVAEMRRLWKADGVRKDKPYGKNDKLLASGGCIRNGKIKL